MELLLSEVRVLREHLAQIDLCLTLEMERQNGRVRRRVKELAAFVRDETGRVTIRRLGVWRESAWEFLSEPLPGVEEWRARVEFLRGLAATPGRSAQAVQEAITHYAGGEGLGQ